MHQPNKQYLLERGTGQPDLRDDREVGGGGFYWFSGSGFRFTASVS